MLSKVIEIQDLENRVQKDLRKFNLNISANAQDIIRPNEGIDNIKNA